MAHQSNKLVKYLKETDVYQNLVESIRSLDKCDPKPAKPLEYIVGKIGLKTICADDFMALKEDFNRLRDEVSSMRKELTKLKMQSIDDIQDIENNNMPVDQCTVNDNEQSMGLVFGDICFEKYTNGIETYNVFAKVDDCCSLINENVNVVSANNPEAVIRLPKNQNILFGMECENETNSNTNAIILSKEIVPAITPKTSPINASHSTEISAKVNTESDDQNTADNSLDQSKTSASDCSHSTEIDAERNVSVCENDDMASETFNTDETSDIQVLEMIPEENETNGSTTATKSSNETVSSEMLQTVSDVSIEMNNESDAAEVNNKSDATNSQSIIAISLDESKTSASDCLHSTDIEAEINILAGESFECGSANNTTIDGLSCHQVVGIIPEEHETDEKMSAILPSNDTILAETGQTIPQSIDNHSNKAVAEELNIGEQSSQNITVISADLSKMNDSEISSNQSYDNIDGKKDKSLETPDESIEMHKNSMESEIVEQNNVSEMTENMEKKFRDCFIQNCDEMQAAKLPSSDSEDSAGKMSITLQSDEMITCNIYQQLPNDKVHEMTGFIIPDSAECFEIDTTMRCPIQPENALIMENIEIPDHEIETINNQIKMEINSVKQELFQGSTSSSSSSSSSDAKTVFECHDGISEHNEKMPNSIEEVKARQFLRDDLETEFLLSVSSATKHSHPSDVVDIRQT